MASFNKVILAGNLTRDPEVRYTPKGTAITRLGVAVNRTWRTESGEQRDETTFVDVDAFGRQAEVIGQYFRKGRPILVEGRLRLDQWDDKNTGQKRSRLVVVLEGFSFLDTGRNEPSGAEEPGNRPPPSRPPAASASPRPGAPAADEAPPPPDDDDVPF